MEEARRYAPRFGEAVEDIAGWLASGELKSKEEVVTGLESVPESLGKLFSGENVGKLVLKVR
ncbi:putative NADP-dependent oxidoreductase YfmJ [compost metagenome]